MREWGETINERGKKLSEKRLTNVPGKTSDELGSLKAPQMFNVETKGNQTSCENCERQINLMALKKLSSGKIHLQD